jgi:enolase-phosphatase E1
MPGSLFDRMPAMPLSTVVLDIEGTTSATSFVVDRLYPYSAERLRAWIDDHPGDPAVVRAVAQVRELIDDRCDVVDALLDWIRTDQKVTPLKTLQGQIWADGFARGDLVSHFFPDVIPAMRSWHASGLTLHIFSSGSVAAQQAWFGHSPEGDLRSLLTSYYDTENAGPKRVASSYHRMADAVAADPAGLLFLSDVTAELDAAREAGWHTIGVRRPGEPHYEAGVGDHREVASFAEVVFP